VGLIAMSFKRDLKRGEAIEMEVLDIIKNKYPDAYKVEGYCKDWDLYIPSIKQGVEVKSDIKSQETGNIVVEVEFNGKPSALSTTKAYRWVFHTGDKIIVTTPERLHKLIKDSKLRLVSFVGKGDRHSKKAYLIKVDLIIDTSIKVL
jgi:hypothetical protein